MANRAAALSTAVLSAALSLSASTGFAGVIAPEFHVTLSFNALCINRVGQVAPTVHLFPGIDVQGFSDPEHSNNTARVSTLNNNHGGQTGQSSFSANFDTVNDLRDSIDDADGWTVEITDGGTDTTYFYTFTLDAAELVADHVRRASIGVLQQGDTISLNPTFNFIVDQPEDPLIQHTLAYATLYGPAGFYTNPTPSPVDTQWTPTGPIEPGTYTFAIQFQGDAPPTLLVPTTPQPQGFEPPLASFSWSSTYGSYVDVSNLIAAAPPACPGDLTGDNAVNTADLTRFLGQFGQACSNVTPPCADFNNDGVVNTADLTFFLGRFGSSCR